VQAARRTACKTSRLTTVAVVRENDARSCATNADARDCGCSSIIPSVDRRPLDGEATRRRRSNILSDDDRHHLAASSDHPRPCSAAVSIAVQRVGSHRPRLTSRRPDTARQWRIQGEGSGVRELLVCKRQRQPILDCRA